MNKLTIVMYHYIRDFKRTRYPGIKGLDINKFKEQILYLKKTFHMCTVDEVLACKSAGESLPESSCLLTFDDGYLDHFTYALPVLSDLGVSGAFFPVGGATEERKILEVNKIHYLLASVSDVEPVISLINENSAQLGLIDELKAKYWQPNRFDPAPINYIKRMLQNGLPEDIRTRLTAELFSKFVTNDEKAFAEELYMSCEQLKTMHKAGMHIGSHTWTHRWLTSLSDEDIFDELSRSAKFVASITDSESPLTICYPYGNFNETVVRLAQELNFKLGVTTVPAVADIDSESIFKLSRMDTNDIKF